MPHKIFFWATSLFLALFLLIAQSGYARPPTPISPGFKDGVRGTVKTSGVVVVAVMLDPTISGLSPSNRNVPVWIPNKTNQKLCLKLQSVDGRYFGNGLYDLSKTEAGRHIVALRISRPDVVEKYREDELVVDARIGIDCLRRETLKPIIASWQATISDMSLAVYVNSSGNSANLFIPSKSDPEEIKTITCNRVASGKPKRLFDAICRAKVHADLDLGDMWVEVSRSGRRLFWEEVDLLAPQSLVRP